MRDEVFTCPDVDTVLAGLKDFQRDSVDYVFRRMYLDPSPARRFLIADEVGLGKTLVARGVVAKVVEHLWDRQPSINIVYICSNSDIARQNVRRLTLDHEHEFNIPDRITLLPQDMDDLRDNPLNFVALTPGTSFDLKDATGRKEERVLLYWMLKSIWRFEGAAAKNVFQVSAGTDHFRWLLNRFDRRHSISPSLKRAFRETLTDNNRHCRSEGWQTLKVRFNWLCKKMPRPRPWRRVPEAVREEIRSFIGELRALLAETCIRALSPDLIILDEFQRFRGLLDGTDDAGELAAKLFEWQEARVILLSATPYKMYTRGVDGGEEDHYRDFLKTADFLFTNDEGRSEQLSQALKQYRRHLYALAEGDGEATAGAKANLESLLRSVMIRTERLAVTRECDGMLCEVRSPVRIDPADVRAYVQLAKIVEWLDSEGDVDGLGDQIEYWKSAPYLLNFMEHYHLKRAFDHVAPTLRRRSPRAQSLAQQIDGARESLLSWSAITDYEEVAPGNPRMRSLWQDVLNADGCELWKILWIPPCSPYYCMSGVYAEPSLAGYTKRLIFSNWKVVPKAIATLTSYEAERRMFLSFDLQAKNTAAARERRARLLDFSRSQGRLTGMPVLGLIYPCTWFADRFDPLRFATPGDDGSQPGVADVLQEFRSEIDVALQPLVAGRRKSGPADTDWYWAAPMLLDQRHHPEMMAAWLDQEDLAYWWRGPYAGGRDGGEDSAWSEHVERARTILAQPDILGRPPANLSRVLAEMTLGGPATVALRALSRVCGGRDSLSDHEVRFAAANIGWALRSLLNSPDVTAMIRGLNRKEPYWRRVLEYGMNGCLQAVLDEYVHLLHESHSLGGRSIEDKAGSLAKAITESASLRVSQPRVDDIRTDEDAKIEITPRPMRAKFALRFGDEASEEESTRKRKEHVRAAFNSPFWPFVLATTSIGQEGLDFHQYCHAVVHWNLPGNPVDLEQREGRVHRYKGHAIRKNIAARYGTGLAFYGASDPWQAMFEAADAEPGRPNDLVPYWLYPVPDGAMIERHLPLLPLSRDGQYLPLLKHALAVYRMVFGQPRQDDLLEYLSQRLSPGTLTENLQELRIDLTPCRKDK